LLLNRALQLGHMCL